MTIRRAIRTSSPNFAICCMPILTGSPRGRRPTFWTGFGAVRTSIFRDYGGFGAASPATKRRCRVRNEAFECRCPRLSCVLICRSSIWKRWTLEVHAVHRFVPSRNAVDTPGMAAAKRSEHAKPAAAKPGQYWLGGPCGALLAMASVAGYLVFLGALVGVCRHRPFSASQREVLRLPSWAAWKPVCFCWNWRSLDLPVDCGFVFRAGHRAISMPRDTGLVAGAEASAKFDRRDRGGNPGRDGQRTRHLRVQGVGPRGDGQCRFLNPGT